MNAAVVTLAIGLVCSILGMTQENSSLLKNLIALSKVDIALARITSEKKKIEKDVLSLHGEIQKEEKDRAQKISLHSQKDAGYKKEEKRLRDEQEKLVSRRKALTTLNNYKLQQAAEKEIEHVSRQLSSQEEALLDVLQEVEELAAQIKAHDESLAEQKKKYDKLISEARKSLADLEKRSIEKKSERTLLANSIESKSLVIYERVKERFIMDPLVEVVNNLCKGCNMQIGPQVLVLIGKGDSLVRCPGCARILYVAEDAIAHSKNEQEVNSS